MSLNLLIVLALASLPMLMLLLLRFRQALPFIFFALLSFPVPLYGEAAAGNVSLADLVAGAAILGVIVRHTRLRGGSVGMAMAAYLIVALLSSILAGDTVEGVLGLGRMLLVTAVPFLWFANGNFPLPFLRRCLTVYCLSTAILGVFSLYFFLTAGIQASMYTLGINKNALGPIFGTGVAVCFTALLTRSIQPKHWWTAAGTLGMCSVGLLLSLSRGGWVGTGAAMIVVLFATRRALPAIIAALFIVPIVAILWLQLPSSSTEYATNISFGSHVLQARFNAQEQALAEFRNNPMLGAGVGLRRRIEPHNVYVLVLGETGIAGVITFSIMLSCGIYSFWRIFRRFNTTSLQWRLALAGLAVFVVFHTQTLVDVYWRRGVGAMSWACVGMAVAMSYRDNPNLVRRSSRVERPSRRPDLATEQKPA